MDLEGLHLLLTYQCTFECDHCFVWGSPNQSGTMTLGTIRKVLTQATDVPSIKWIYFEGGEPFLYYQVMVAGINAAYDLGFQVGIVTNSYWATSEEDALLWLSPIAGKIQDLSISSDLFHSAEKVSQQSVNASRSAELLGIPTGIICIEKPEIEANLSVGQIPQSSSSIMFRGRAAEKLGYQLALQPVDMFNSCPHEDLFEPGRLHVDPFGELHICQGISLGNIHQTSIKEVCEKYDPTVHPILGPLVTGGPGKLAEQYQVKVSEYYADACHLCNNTRRDLRDKFPEILRPDQMYGVFG